MPNIGSALKTQTNRSKTKQVSPLKARNDETAIVSGEMKEVVSQDLSGKDEHLHTINEFLKDEQTKAKTYF